MDEAEGMSLPTINLSQVRPFTAMRSVRGLVQPLYATWCWSFVLMNHRDVNHGFANELSGLPVGDADPCSPHVELQLA